MCHIGYQIKARNVIYLVSIQISMVIDWSATVPPSRLYPENFEREGRPPPLLINYVKISTLSDSCKNTLV